MIRLSAVILFVGLSACQASREFCPTPELVRLKRSNPNKLHLFGNGHRQQMVASNRETYDYFRKPDVEPKELRNIETWDCPKPGLKHDKMVAKKQKQLQKRYEQNLKRVAKESEERTATVVSDEPNR